MHLPLHLGSAGPLSLWYAGPYQGSEKIDHVDYVHSWELQIPYLLIIISFLQAIVLHVGSRAYKYDHGRLIGGSNLDSNAVGLELCKLRGPWSATVVPAADQSYARKHCGVSDGHESSGTADGPDGSSRTANHATAADGNATTVANATAAAVAPAAVASTTTDDDATTATACAAAAVGSATSAANFSSSGWTPASRRTSSDRSADKARCMGRVGGTKSSRRPDDSAGERHTDPRATPVEGLQTLNRGAAAAVQWSPKRF